MNKDYYIKKLKKIIKKIQEAIKLSYFLDEEEILKECSEELNNLIFDLEFDKKEQ